MKQKLSRFGVGVCIFFLIVVTVVRSVVFWGLDAPFEASWKGSVIFVVCGQMVETRRFLGSMRSPSTLSNCEMRFFHRLRFKIRPELYVFLISDVNDLPSRRVSCSSYGGVSPMSTS